MDFNVNVKFDATEELRMCVLGFRDMVSMLTGPRVAYHEAAEREEQAETPKEESEEPTPEVEEPKAQPEAAAVPSISDMREAVNQLRIRIEGEDWEDKASEGYKRWHKKVTTAVKGIVAFCGADKIPGIPEEMRANFIQKVSELGIVGEAIQPTIPF